MIDAAKWFEMIESKLPEDEKEAYALLSDLLDMIEEKINEMENYEHARRL